MTITLDDVRRAAEKIRGSVIATPATHSRTLSEISGAHIVLKFENLQFTASFKERGALHKLLSLDASERARGVIAMSAGNHAQAVAYHAQRLGIPATIVMPRATPNVKVEQTAAFGAEVILQGADLEEASDWARKIERERGSVFVHPYDDPRVIAGAGTAALELLEAHPDLEMLVVPVGGGSLISGCAIAARALSPNIEIIGVEASRYPAIQRALENKPAEFGGATIAEGIAVKAPGKFTLPLVRELVDEILLVDEAPLEEAVRLLLEVEKTVVEGAGAAALAAVLAHRARFEGRRAGLILSGGNIDLLSLSSIIQRGLARSRRLVRMCVEVRDVPGQLAEVSQLLGSVDANIVEVHHQRAFSNLPLKTAEVEFVLQTRGNAHCEEILRKLEAAGYSAHCT